MDIAKNLALGRPVTVYTSVPDGNSYRSMEKGTKEMLTDGCSGDPSDCYNGQWAHFYRAIGRRLQVDLGQSCAVTGFEAGFIQGASMGIYCPETVTLYLSEDGKSYFEAASAAAPYPATYGETVRAVYSAKTQFPVRARYAELEFSVEVNVFCDEIKILGAPCDGSEKLLSGTPRALPFADSYESRDCLGGICDVPLLYYGYWPENDRIANNTKEDFLPYVAYVDSEGNVVDTMFDGMMFLIVQGRCPSGGNLGYSGPPSVLSDWEYVLEALFRKGVGLSALNETVGDVKKKLLLPDGYSFPVFVTVPTPKISNTPFGDTDGDGIEEKLLTVDDCVNAYCMYVDRLKKRFESARLSNLCLAGCFWGNESVSRAHNDREEEYASKCVSALHDRGLKCIFIPYYQAGGSEKAKKIGFDCVTMQPNLSFNSALQDDPERMMEDFAALCRQYGFGVELEVHHGIKNKDTAQQYGTLFDHYLRACVKNGMMKDTVHTYYQCAGPGVFYDMAYSKDPYLRGMYDKLYRFIKGTLSYEEPEQGAEDASETVGEPLTEAEPDLGKKTGSAAETKQTASPCNDKTDADVAVPPTEKPLCAEEATEEPDKNDPQVRRTQKGRAHGPITKKSVQLDTAKKLFAAAAVAAGVCYLVKKLTEKR